MKKNNKGFTLAELLIVVAIIAVLVAIAIPVFTTQLEKSREGVDAANIRSAYAEVIAANLGNGINTQYYKEITLKQKSAKWVSTFDYPTNLSWGADATVTAGSPPTITAFTATETTIATGTADQKVYVINSGTAEGYAYITVTAPTSGMINVDTLVAVA